MQLAPELVAGGLAAAALLIGLLFLRARARRTRNVGRPVSRGPANLRFTCAGCSHQFTHSRRTLGAWGKGTRQFYCNACHTKWRGAQAAQATRGNAPAVSSTPRTTRRTSRTAAVGQTSPASSLSKRSRAGSGCLGVAALLIGVPAAVVVAVLQYA
jgi:hypothetical protein